jgi:DNA-binding transcriptional regulator YdaS (Cro superfamily)
MHHGQQIPPEKRALYRAAEVLGGQAEIASLLGYPDRRNVSHWFKKDGPRFPADHCLTVEAATRALKDPDKVVTCEELRPDMKWHVLRSQPLQQEA